MDFCIETGIGAFQPESASGNDSETAPGSVRRIEDFFHDCSGCMVAFGSNHPGIVIEDFRVLVDSQFHEILDSKQYVEGLETRDHAGFMEFLRQVFVRF